MVAIKRKQPKYLSTTLILFFDKLFFLFWAKAPMVCIKKHSAHKIISVFWYAYVLFSPISNPLYKELGTPFPSIQHIIHKSTTICSYTQKSETINLGINFTRKWSSRSNEHNSLQLLEYGKKYVLTWNTWPKRQLAESFGDLLLLDRYSFPFQFKKCAKILGQQPTLHGSIFNIQQALYIGNLIFYIVCYY